MTDEVAPRRGPIVVGLGSPDQGDDAVGPAVACAVAELGLCGVETAVHEDPTALIHLWEGVDVAVVIDAVLSGQAAGTITVREVGAGEPSLPEESWEAIGRGGTHAFGLATAVELARTLGRIPRRVMLVGIEAKGFEQGTPLSTEVAASITDAVQIIRAMASECVGSAA